MHATSTTFRNMLSLICSKVKKWLNSSSPSSFWYTRRNVFSDFVCILSPKVKFWIMYGFALCSSGREDTVCELIGGWESGKFRLLFLFC